MQNKYYNSVIYKIVCRDPNIQNIFISATSSSPWVHSNMHKQNCNNPESKLYNIPLYKFIRANGGWTNWYVVPMYRFFCSNKNERNAEIKRAVSNNKFSTLNCKNYDDVPDAITPNLSHYYEKDRERYIILARNYAYDNRIEIRKKKTARVVCACKYELSQVHLVRHFKTARHLDYSFKHPELNFKDYFVV